MPIDHADDINQEGRNEDGQFVALVDQHGSRRLYIFLRVIDLKNEPEAGQFVALTPVEESEDPDSPTQILLFHYSFDDEGDEVYSDIQDDELFACVQAAAEEYFAQLDAENENAENIKQQAALASIADIVTATGPEVDITPQTEEVRLKPPSST